MNFKPLHEGADGMRRDGVLVGLALLLGFVFHYLFYAKEPGVSFPIFIAASIACLFIVLQVAGRKPTWSEYWLALPTLLFALMVAWRSNHAVQAMNVLLSLGLFLLLISVAAGRKVRDHAIMEYPRLALEAVGFIPRSIKTVSELLVYGKQHTHRKTFGQILKGILLAIPFLLLFTLLFSSADLAFSAFLSGIVPAVSFYSFWYQFWVVALVTMFFIGGFSAAYRKSYLPDASVAAGSFKVEPLMVSTLLFLVNALFLVFIVLQIEYFFGSAAAIERWGFTYADYARRGFFELLAVAAVSFAMLLVLENALVKKEQRHHAAFKALSFLHIVLVLAVIFSAYQRLTLYEQAYGFTTLRFFVHATVLLLTGVFLLLLRKILFDGREKEFVFQMLLVVMLFSASVTVANPDAFVASKNMKRFQESQKIDAPYIGYLSADALPVTLPLLAASDLEVRMQYAQALRENFMLARIEGKPWQSMILSELRVADLLRANGFDLQAEGFKQ